MTTTEQKHAIALACGLKHEPPPKDLNLEWGATPPPGVFWFDHQLPAYTTDLNAMHEVFATITEESEMDQLVNVLMAVIHGQPFYDIHDDFCDADGWTLCTATAAQRAEAFLRVKGLWK